MKALKELLINLFHFAGLAWWVEIATDSPRCTYYFGPFLDQQEAATATQGYIEDLQYEGAQGITASVKRCKPNNLTVYDELEDLVGRRSSPVFSGQV